MEQNDPMKPSEEVLIAKIRETLATYEEPYVDGAWENFDQPAGRKLPILWLTALSGVAAVLLFGLFFITRSGKTTPEVVKTKQPTETIDALKNIPAPVNNNTPELIAATPTIIEERSVNISDKPLKSFQKEAPKTDVPFVKNELNNSFDPVKNNPVIANQVTPAVKSVETKINEPIKNNPAIAQADPTLIKVKEPVKNESKQSIEEFLKDQSQLNADIKPEKPTVLNKKWDLGLVVAPSVSGTNKVNIGYGLTLGYVLSSKLSLQSGLSYNELGGPDRVREGFYAMASAPTTGAPGTGAPAPGRILESTEGRFKGIDIPLELRLNLSKNFYANAGISAFAVLNQAQENSYLESKLVQRSDVNATGNIVVSSYFVTDRITIEEPPTAAQKIDYLGFYNLSLGYKKNFSTKNTFSFEPFIKVPIKTTATQNFNLFGAGLRLKFGF